MGRTRVLLWRHHSMQHGVDNSSNNNLNLRGAASNNSRNHGEMMIRSNHGVETVSRLGAAKTRSLGEATTRSLGAAMTPRPLGVAVMTRNHGAVTTRKLGVLREVETRAGITSLKVEEIKADGVATRAEVTRA